MRDVGGSVPNRGFSRCSVCSASVVLIRVEILPSSKQPLLPGRLSWHHSNSATRAPVPVCGGQSSVGGQSSNLVSTEE